MAISVLDKFDPGSDYDWGIAAGKMAGRLANAAGNVYLGYRKDAKAETAKESVDNLVRQYNSRKTVRTYGTPESIAEYRRKVATLQAELEQAKLSDTAKNRARGHIEPGSPAPEEIKSPVDKYTGAFEVA